MRRLARGKCVAAIGKGQCARRSSSLASKIDGFGAKVAQGECLAGQLGAFVFGDLLNLETARPARTRQRGPGAVALQHRVIRHRLDQAKGAVVAACWAFFPVGGIGFGERRIGDEELARVSAVSRVTSSR